jgi:hypothetical protein
MSFSLARRLGKFEISIRMIRDTTMLNPVVFNLMGKVIIVRAEDMFVKQAIEYMAISPEFDEVPDGCEIPWYDYIQCDGTWKFIPRKELQ